MKTIQILKANHHSKNGAIIAADIDIALLNADRNLTRPEKHREPNKSFYHERKNIKIYQVKVFEVIIAQENNFQITILILDHKPPIKKIFTANHQIGEIQKIFHKICIAYQTTKIISIETIAQVQTQTEIINQTIIGTDQILGIDIIPITAQKTFRIKDHKTTPTIDHIIII